MLLVITVLLALGGAWALFKKHNVIGISALILLVICQAFILLDSTQHFGTTTFAATKTEQIAPVADIKGNQIMIKEKVKQGKTEYSAYATKKPGKSTIHTVLNKQKTVKVNQTKKVQAYKETTNDKYRYNNGFERVLYTGITNSGQVKQQTITYHIDSTWHQLSKQQLKSAAKVLKEPKTLAQIKSEVTADVQRQVKQDPSIASSDTKMKKLENKALEQSVSNVLDNLKS